MSGTVFDKRWDVYVEKENGSKVAIKTNLSYETAVAFRDGVIAGMKYHPEKIVETYIQPHVEKKVEVSA